MVDQISGGLGRRIRARFCMLIASGLLVGMAFAGANVTSAAANTHGCPLTYGCGWVDAEYGTPMGQWAEDNPNLGVFGQKKCQTGNWGDCISSIYNNGVSCNLGWHTATNYGGEKYHNNLGTGSGKIGTWNDRFLSDYWCGY